MFWRKKKCPVDAGKSECSLIQELRQLQEEVEQVRYKYPALSLRCYNFTKIYGIYIEDITTQEDRVEKLEEALKNTKYNMEIDVITNKKKERINEIKKELGIN